MIPNLRELETRSIAAFIESCGEHFRGKRVLDFGSGTQPYRTLIESFGAEYTPYDAPQYPASRAEKDTTGQTFGKTYDTLLVTQVIQYVERPGTWLIELRARFLRPTEGDAALVMTYPTNWPEVEDEDLHRFTKAGMARLLTDAGFHIQRHEPRQDVAVSLDGERLVAGYGVLATIPKHEGARIVSTV